MYAMRGAVLHSFARQLTRSTQHVRQDAQLQVFVEPILLFLFRLYRRYFILFVVEEEDFVVSALVQNVFIDTFLVCSVLSVDFERNGVGNVERVIAPEAAILRVLPKRDDSKISRVTGLVRLSLFQAAIAILNESVFIVCALLV